MRRRGGGSTGRSRSRSSKTIHRQNTRIRSNRNGSTVQRERPRRAVRKKTANLTAPVRVERRRRVENTHPIRDRVPGRRVHRGASVRAQRSPRKRLSAGLLPLRRPNENASRQQTTRSVCARKKETRRAVIIANGHGGINNANRYRRHRKC
jgi:hypothetical protein